MQIIKSLVKLFVFICPLGALAQSTYLYDGAKEYKLIDRLEIKQQANTGLNFTTMKPYSRKFVVQQAEFIDSASQKSNFKLTKIDRYNLNSLLMNNSEWVTGSQQGFLSKKPLFKSFYKTKSNLLEVNTKDFFLVVNPVLQLNISASSDSERIFLNTRGVNVRGRIADKLGFSAQMTENQERGPLFFRERVQNLRAVPGVGFYKIYKNSSAVDYFDARGYITFNAIKYIDFQLGYDKNFIGNGYRSLFLSNEGNSYLFAKINTKIWKINYQNIFMELMPQFKKRSDTLLDRKYAAIHHLSMNVTKWLNIGVFESVVFGRKNNFDFQYLNPIIFYRHIEGTLGSPDNAMAGFDFKANVARKFQFYGQFLLDELIVSKLRNDPTNWVNKFGIQAGAKYIDALGIKNLDLQLEINRVRPFTYSHNDTIANYTHYNQPLAHPLGANFEEIIGILNYQPAPKWYVHAKAIYYKLGLDSAGKNFGGNIFRDYRTRVGENGYSIGSGSTAKCFNGLLQVSYELKENLFFDLSLQYRKYKLATLPDFKNATLFTAGIRLNMAKRVYDY